MRGAWDDPIQLLGLSLCLDGWMGSTHPRWTHPPKGNIPLRSWMADTAKNAERARPPVGHVCSPHVRSHDHSVSFQSPPPKPPATPSLLISLSHLYGFLSHLSLHLAAARVHREAATTAWASWPMAVARVARPRAAARGAQTATATAVDAIFGDRPMAGMTVEGQFR